MKRLLFAMCAILLGVVSLSAQDDLYKELGKKYDKMDGKTITEDNNMAIMIDEKNQIFTLQTKNSTYQISNKMVLKFGEHGHFVKNKK